MTRWNTAIWLVIGGTRIACWGGTMTAFWPSNPHSIMCGWGSIHSQKLEEASTSAWLSLGVKWWGWWSDEWEVPSLNSDGAAISLPPLFFSSFTFSSLLVQSYNKSIIAFLRVEQYGEILSSRFLAYIVPWSLNPQTEYSPLSHAIIVIIPRKKDMSYAWSIQLVCKPYERGKLVHGLVKLWLITFHTKGRLNLVCKINSFE